MLPRSVLPSLCHSLSDHHHSQPLNNCCSHSTQIWNMYASYEYTGWDEFGSSLMFFDRVMPLKLRKNGKSTLWSLSQQLLHTFSPKFVIWMCHRDVQVDWVWIRFGSMIFDSVFCINLFEFSFIFLRELIISTTITHIKLKFDICMNVS